MTPRPDEVPQAEGRGPQDSVIHDHAPLSNDKGRRERAQGAPQAGTSPETPAVRDVLREAGIEYAVPSLLAYDDGDFEIEACVVVRRADVERLVRERDEARALTELHKPVRLPAGHAPSVDRAVLLEAARYIESWPPGAGMGVATGGEMVAAIRRAAGVSGEVPASGACTACAFQHDGTIPNGLRCACECHASPYPVSGSPTASDVASVAGHPARIPTDAELREAVDLVADICDDGQGSATMAVAILWGEIMRHRGEHLNDDALSRRRVAGGGE